MTEQSTIVPPLRVCRVIARLNVGGPARHVALLDRGLRERGFDTTLAFGDVGPDEASLERLVHEAGNPAVRIAHLGRRISALGDARAFFSLVRLMFRMRPDVVHTHTAKAGTLGRLAALVFNLAQPQGRRCVIVHTFHGHVFAGYFGRAGSAAVRAIERALARITDRIVVIAEQQRVDVVERYRIAPAGKVSVVPLGLDLGSLLALTSGAPSLREELGIHDDHIVLGFVGRFAPIKDLPTLLRAFASAAAREPRARLVLAGDGEARPAVEEMIRSLGLDSRVILAGWRSDLPSLYATFDAVVLSSINEGTPVAVIEAMAAGLPIVSTAAGGVGDVVEHGVTGWIVPVRDADALAGALVDVCASAEWRERAGAAARRAVSRYAHTRLVADIERLYRDELSRRKRCP